MSIVSVVGLSRSYVALYRAVFAAYLAFGLSAGILTEAFAKSDKVESRAAKSKPRSPAKGKPAPPPAQLDPVTEWEVINGDAISYRNALAGKPDDEDTRQKLAELALRSARAAERALSRGDEDLFHAFRTQIESTYPGVRDRIEYMSERGVGAADFALATFALHGMLGERSIGHACASFATALDKGFRGARYRVAQCLEDRDPERATTLMREAAEAGHVAAMEHLGRACLETLPPDVACAYMWIERAAREGRASAKTYLAWMHVEGIGGRQDFALAAQLYRDAARQGESSAANNLGELLENGRGVTRNERAAADYYRQAAEAGFPPAQFNLGRLYAAGRGVDKDVGAARRWLAMASAAGIDRAQRIIELLDGDTER